MDPLEAMAPFVDVAGDALSQGDFYEFGVRFGEVVVREADTEDWLTLVGIGMGAFGGALYDTVVVLNDYAVKW